MTTKQQFLDFLAEIEPSDTTVSCCSSAHSTLRDKLASHETFKKVHIGTFLSGSYVRKTAIRPTTAGGELQRPDVDIIAETSHKSTDQPKDVINQLHQALADGGYSSLRKNRRSVSVLLTTVDMDVVPIIENGSSYLIPDTELGKWITTNPPGHTQWATERNQAAGCRFKPLVKLLKWWRRKNLADLRRPKGFILEAMVADQMCYSEQSYEELFAKLMRSFKASYQYIAETGGVPHLADPAVPGNNVFSAVTVSEFKQFYDMVCTHVTLIEAAQAESDEKEQLTKWRKVFGQAFPAAGGTRAANEGLMQTAAAVGLAFPQHAVAPKKQQGFA
jgi:hypothetical protein